MKATWKNGHIVLDGPASWPEGSRLVINEELPADIEFLTEEEQADDLGSIERWIAELREIPPLPMTPEQEADMLAWRQKVKAFNLEAVRRQMEEGIP
jgi:hypothetical protein